MSNLTQKSVNNEILLDDGDVIARHRKVLLGHRTRYQLVNGSLFPVGVEPHHITACSHLGKHEVRRSYERVTAETDLSVQHGEGYVTDGNGNKGDLPLGVGEYDSED